MQTIKLSWLRPPVGWVVSRETEGLLTLSFYNDENPGTREEQLLNNRIELGHQAAQNLLEVVQAYLNNPYETKYKERSDDYE